MCTNFVPSVRQEIAALAPGVALPEDDWPAETFPGYLAPVLMRGKEGEVLCRTARFGLIPRWCKDAAQANTLSRKTYNARSETASEKPSYRGPWSERQWAVVPMRCYFDPCWEDAHLHGGKAVRWQMALRQAPVFGAAGLWESWTHPQDGEVVHSFTLLTVNADGHGVMGRMHRPGEEKRMPVLLAATQWMHWLHSSSADAASWMQAWPAQEMVAGPAPRATAAATLPQNLSLF